MTDGRRLNIPQIAAELGFSVSAVKKWRQHTRRVLRKAGQLDAINPTVLLPTNALPIPANQREHVLDGVEPRWDRDVIVAWAKRTERQHPETGETTHPSPPGRTPDPDRAPRVRRRTNPAAELVAAAA